MYKILDWNTGLTENDANYLEIIEYIKLFLENENAIVVLQQIPYKIKGAYGNWVYSDVYIKFENTFLNEEYNVISNNKFNNGYIFMQTLIITKIKSLLPIDESVYPNGCSTNREAAIKIENAFSVLGLHAKNGEENLSYIQSINGNADIIVGDFNAGDYLEYPYWEKFRKILPSHICICSLPTKRVENYKGELVRETCIDHIYVKRELITKCSNVIVHNDNKLSDHYPITFCIE